MTTVKKIVLFLVLFLILLSLIFYLNGRHYNERWKDLTFKGIVSKEIRKPRMTYFQFITKDSVFELKDSFKQDFRDKITLGDSIFKIGGSNYCILYNTNAKVIVSEF